MGSIYPFLSSAVLPSFFPNGPPCLLEGGFLEFHPFLRFVQYAFPSDQGG